MSVIKWCFTLGFAFLSLYHLFLAFIPNASDAAVGQRHLLFFLIYIGATILVAWDKPKALLLLIPLILMQVFSHAVILWEAQTFIGMSSFVLLAMAVLSFYVMKKYRTSAGRGTVLIN